MIIIAGLVGSLFGVFLMWMMSGHDQCNKEIAHIHEGEVGKEYPKLYISKLLNEIRELKITIDDQKHELSRIHTKYSNIWIMDIPSLQKRIMELEEENITLKKKLNSYLVEGLKNDQTTV